MNIQGLLSHKSQLSWFVLERKPLVVCVSETHVTRDVSDCEIQIKGYNAVCSYSTSVRTGGAIIYLKQELRYKEILNFNKDMNIWAVGVELKVGGHKGYIVNLYHSPSQSDAEFLIELDRLLYECAYDGQLVIVGDFNINMARKTFYSEKLARIISNYGLYQICNEHTRVTQESATLIDLIVTNNKELKYQLLSTPKISDHGILLVKLFENDKITTNKIWLRNFKDFNELDFQIDLMKEVWIPNCVITDILADKLVGSIITVLNRYAPLEEKTITVRWGDRKWWNKRVGSEISNRDRLYKRAVITGKELDWDNFRKQRNYVVSMIREEKRKYYTRKIDGVKTNSYEMWKTLKQIIKTDRRGNKKCGIIFDAEVTDSVKIAEKFNNYFIDSIKEIVDSIIRTESYEVTLDRIHAIDSKMNGFNIISMSELRKLIKDLNNKLSSVDGINTKILKISFEAIGDRFLNLINNSLVTGTFPKGWKLSTVIPVEKKPNATNCSDFRPVNMVPLYEKLLEMVVNKQITDYCENYKILSQHQAGFRRRNSCETAIQSVLSDWKNALEKKQVVGAVFLDFRRAFETIDRHLLIGKLEKYGFGPTVINWMREYLFNRTQKTKYDGKTSSPREVNYGVPQGTVLGPSLFVLYINDIVSVVEKCKIQLFADDTLLYCVGSDVKSVVDTLNSELKYIENWLNNNSLKVNTDKSNVMLITSRYSSLSTENHAGVLFNNSRIKQVDEIKYLGVVIDKNLTFSSHAAYITNKIAKKVNFLSRIGKDLSPWTKTIIYKTIILPHLNFCSTLLFLANKSDINVLQKKQNQALRVILGCGRYARVNNMLEAVNILSVRQVIWYNTAIFIYKIIHGLLPHHLYNNCSFVSEVHGYNTRSQDNFYIRTVSTNYSQNSLFHNGLKIYNDIPTHIKKAATLSEFKVAYKKYVRLNIL